MANAMREVDEDVWDPAICDIFSLDVEGTTQAI